MANIFTPAVLNEGGRNKVRPLLDFRQNGQQVSPARNPLTAAQAATHKERVAMQRHPSITKPYAALSALLLAVSLTTFAFAQTKAAAKSQAKLAAPAPQAPAQRQLISLTFLRIKPGMGPEWQEFRKSETLPALRKAEVKEQSVWNTAIFGEGGYVIVTPIGSLTQYDNPSPTVRALGQEGARAYGARLRGSSKPRTQ